MISLNMQQKQHIGLQYVIDLTDPKSAYGKEKLRNAKPYTREKQKELQQHLDNI